MVHKRILASLVTLFLTTSCVFIARKHIVGQTEMIVVVEAGFAFKARIDTGAKHTSIHATDISVDGGSEVMAENIGKEITFKTINEKNESRNIKTTIKEVSSVKNSQGKEFRYVIEMELAWRGVSKKVKVNLRNREKMAYKLLIGRNWLEHDFFVDVGRGIPEDNDDDDSNY